VAKERGVKLGSPSPKNGVQISAKTLREKADRFALDIQPIIKELQKQDICSYKALAQALNLRGIQTANKRKWYATTVKNILHRKGILI